jgi:hypothetical protein
MVHLKLNLAREEYEMSGNQLIKLESNQASQVPFPPDCPVIVLEDENIMYSGIVAAVYISFDHNTGLCLNYYRVSSTDRNGEEFSEVVSGDKVRYAINCPIKVCLMLITSETIVSKGLSKALKSNLTIKT